MSYSQYTLDIISNHPKFNNKTLRKYNVDGIETVGAWGNEPFEIRFRNNSWQRVSVKISIDGTDIMTGDLASTTPAPKMWLVAANSTMTLTAWPETNNGGARFLFTSGEKGVAANTHGDVSNRGIIAAAVFVEGHVEPQRLYTSTTITTYNHDTIDARINRRARGGELSKGARTLELNSKGLETLGENQKGFDSNERGFDYISEGSRGREVELEDSGPVPCSAAASRSYSDISAAPASIPVQELKSLASVGAGEYATQNITYVKGLTKPTFTETIRVRYLWWDDLEAKLRENNRVDEQPSGFPADRKNIDLGKTPRQESPKGHVKRSYPVEYSRV